MESEYSIRNRLYVRRQGAVVGDRIDDPTTNSEQDRAAKRLVILIHGYQNSEQKAAASFGDFVAGIATVLEDRLDGFGAIWEFHWPGDHPFAPLSVATYGARVGVAVAAGERLARWWLARRQPDQQVVIVAHSLGCRVALEAINWIRAEDELRAQDTPPASYRGASAQAVFLLAAAVPVHLCDPAAQGYLEAPWRGCREHVFHSRRDRVLRHAFGLGEWVANERGPAVGLDGAPAHRWSSTQPTGLGHGDYWGSADVAAAVAALLGLATRRDPAFRPLPATHASERGLSHRAFRERRLRSR